MINFKRKGIIQFRIQQNNIQQLKVKKFRDKPQQKKFLLHKQLCINFFANYNTQMESSKCYIPQKEDKQQMNLSTIIPQEESQNNKNDSYSFLHYQDQSLEGESYHQLQANGPFQKSNQLNHQLQSNLQYSIPNIDSNFMSDEPSFSSIDQNQSALDDLTSLNQSDILSFIGSESKNLFQKHQKQVICYLLKLSNPQGEISNICQNLNNFQIKHNDHDFQNDNNEWEWTSKIYLPQTIADSDHPKFIQTTQSSQTKVLARKFACMDLLKNLYLIYPQVWIDYKDVREVKNFNFEPELKGQRELNLIKDVSNFQKLSDQIMLKFFHRQQIQIRTMMEKICAKEQMNMLIQHLPRQIKSPKLQHQFINGKNQIPVIIQYKTQKDIKQNKPGKVYKNLGQHSNKKIAEENAYKKAIITMYEENPQLFEKVQKIKRVKKLKESPKKLPFF